MLCPGRRLSLLFIYKKKKNTKLIVGKYEQLYTMQKQTKTVHPSMYVSKTAHSVSRIQFIQEYNPYNPKDACRKVDEVQFDIQFFYMRFLTQVDCIIEDFFEDFLKICKNKVSL